ncbi:response regulator [Prolixibacteraceae bacterium Z1-6]|uniref:histidine kinase n=1 Tax=Draconibacterium aestuarii TaxID=2998507 RepID=A0A9X3J820_9BACT|nr:response regulator [Prolixibacteraceae bacterium Z1-6]
MSQGLKGNNIKPVFASLFIYFTFLIHSFAAATPESQYKFMHIDVNDGLSNNEVHAILKDSNGFMWFGTSRGLNRFDGTKFKIYKYQPDENSSMPFNSIDFLFEDPDQNIWIRSLSEFAIFNSEKESFTSADSYYKNTSIPLFGLRSLFTDHAGNLWFLNQNQKLYKYATGDLSVDSIQYIPSNASAVNSYLKDLKEDSNHKVWAVSNAGELVKINPGSYEIEYSCQLDSDYKNETNNFNLFIDKDDDIWIYSPGQPNGLYFLRSGSNEVIHYTELSTPLKLNSVLVSSVTEDDEGEIWIATDHGGINIFDKKTQSILYVQSDRMNDYCISQNSVTCLYKDRQGIIWAGTFKKGVSYYHKNLIRFDHYAHQPANPNSLPFNDVNCFAEDDRGNLWIGTNGGGLIYFDRAKNTFKTYLHNPDNTESLASNIIVSLYIDAYKQLWIGTYFGGLDRFDGQKFYHHRHKPGDSTTLADDRVWEIMEDSKKNFWVGTLNGGLNLYDHERERFFHYRAYEMNSVGSNFITSIVEDSESNLWIGTSDGLDVLNLTTKQFKHFAPSPGVPGKLSNKNAIDLHEDSHGLIWIATNEGLNIYSKTENVFRNLTEKEGLPDSNIKTIIEDQHGNLWISTTIGISRISILNYSEQLKLSELQFDVVSYNKLDGLQGKEFNEKAAYRMRSGEVVFGGANGFNLFIPENLDDNFPENKVVLTNFKVFNRNVKVGEPFRKRIILEKSVLAQNEITLYHNENVFSFEFAALNFFHPEKNSFEYLLDGFNTEWLKVDASNDITFTNLNAGDYQLRIRVSDDGKNWKEMQQPLKIKILPPYWKTKVAYFLYFLLIISIFYIARKMMLERQRLKLEAQHEHLEAVRMQELDALKTRFFMNISHEFRTPLTLILTPIEKLLSLKTDSQQKTQLELIHRNASRLLSMVNQLLDFRKLEVQAIKAKPKWGELVSFSKHIGESFSDMAENKQIDYKFKAGEAHLYTYFDHDKVEKILSNLLSNAYKFTPENGEISLALELRKNQFASEEEKKTGTFIATVKDSGIGISPEKQNKIFDRFFQDDLPGDFVQQGSGIGLSMVKEYVEILGGSIRVESTDGNGSSFAVNLPVQLFSEKEIEVNKLQEPVKKSEFVISITTETTDAAYDSEKKTILLVEDNHDFRNYLKNHLNGRYNILEAPHGKAGWEQVLKHMPDLVVSDVMMPQMNGVELCSKIKNDARTSHVPVILLTAKVETEDTLEGFSSGADDYISKPFDFRILETRIGNIISTREKLQHRYQSMLGINPEKIKVKSLDEEFIKKALEIVEENMANAGFSVEDMAQELAMSRVSLYKKLLSLTKTPPVEFIRIIRLKRAADYMKDSQMSVSEIAYKVGFNSPRYFSKYFKEFYKELPSEYIKKYRKSRRGFRF